jgi:hypothetical protein
MRDAPLATLARHRVSDDASLAAAATAAGFHISNDVKGYADGILRLDDQKVRIAGWAANVAGDRTPLELTVFLNGVDVSEIQTKGERPDVTQALKLSTATAQNVGFEGVVSCNPGDKIIIVVTTSSNKYLPLDPRPISCP